MRSIVSTKSAWRKDPQLSYSSSRERMKRVGRDSATIRRLAQGINTLKAFSPFSYSLILRLRYRYMGFNRLERTIVLSQTTSCPRPLPRPAVATFHRAPLTFSTSSTINVHPARLLHASLQCRSHVPVVLASCSRNTTAATATSAASAMACLVGLAGLLDDLCKDVIDSFALRRRALHIVTSPKLPKISLPPSSDYRAVSLTLCAVSARCGSPAA